MNLTLDDHDPRVTAARDAEAALFRSCGIKYVERYIMLSNPRLRLRVCEFGEGEPVVVVPGNTGDAFPLASLIATLKGRRVIAINRPGGGLSEGMDHRVVDIRRFAVETLDAVWEAYGLGDVPVIAHSMGAHWSIWFAMDRPSRVRSLITLGNPGNVMAGKPPALFRLLFKLPFKTLWFGALRARSPARSLRMLGLMGHDPARIAQLLPDLAECYFRFGQLPHYPVSLLSLMENAPAPLTAADLATVNQPVMMLWGTRDTFATLAQGKDMAAAIPKGSLQAIEGAGHLPWLEDPIVCGDAILDFLHRTPRATHQCHPAHQ